MAKQPTERQAINLLKHLPGYAVIFGWNRSTLAKTMLRWFLSPDAEDMSRKAQSIRSFIGGYRLDELSREKTTINNMEPFCTMLQLGVTFDRLLEFSVQLGIDPFTTLPKHINGLEGKGVFGQWVGGLSAPSRHIQEATDRFFIDNLGHGHHVFVDTNDRRLIRLGYLVDGRPKSEHQNWLGCREKPGGDNRLLLTNLAASFPLYRHTQKSKWGSVKVRWFKGQPQYALELDMDEKRYIRKSYWFGVTRFERLKMVRRMARHLEIIERKRQQLGSANTF